MKLLLQTCKDVMRDAVVDERREDSTEMGVAKLTGNLCSSHVAVGKLRGICFGGTKES